ncbi:MAG TPA: type II secretion system protein GspK [Nitrospirota bacterium]|nr:type II secretion system protein GspK [Nitrospirota bacterium]
MRGWRVPEMKNHGGFGNRGVALLLVLLVTALLVALIFEFAYGTRVSLHAAVNFRDGQRAYFLARSGIYVFAKSKDLRDAIPQGEWSVVPIVSSGDTELRLRWVDELGKIYAADVKTNKVTYNIVQALFENRSVDLAVLDRMTDAASTISKVGLLSGLHQYMSDEEYDKVKDFLTVTQTQGTTRKININTAPIEVLQSLCKGLGKDDSVAGLIISRRESTPYASTSDIVNMPGMDPLVASYLDVTSNIYKVYASATVGGYTKQVEAIIDLTKSSPLYWREL